MIHDILLCLMEPGVSRLPIEDFMISEISNKFLHPGERNILENIIKAIKQYQDIKQFIDRYGNHYSTSQYSLKSLESDHDGDVLQKGLYLQAFCDGVENTLERYRNTIIELEGRYLRKPTLTLIFIFQQIKIFQPLFTFLIKLISGIKTQRLHGCMILQFLHQNSLHGSELIFDSVKIIQKSVYTIFLKQLSEWLIYGKFNDIYFEFFIQHVENKNISNNEKLGSTVSLGQNTATTVSDSTSINTELWRYEIFYDMFPNYFTVSWGEKVLYIGQTVLMFSSRPYDSAKKNFDKWMSDENDCMRTVNLWGYQEQIYYIKIQKLLNEPHINIAKFDAIIDEIKSCITMHLSEIAIENANLLKQLHLIKDFYLLGRGELFLEFLKKISGFPSKISNDGLSREFDRAFQLAATSVNVSDDIEQFSLYYVKDDSEGFSYDTNDFLNYITLRFKVIWPLHLLFSPKVLEQYNNLFRFLLRIKKIQYDLQLVWCFHREQHFKKNENVQFRNKLMFLVDNLQYYLQVDVLESQYSILVNAIKNSKDIEHIQRAHSLFQANILSFSFLLSAQRVPKKDSSIYLIENPVLNLLNKIFIIINQFCKLSFKCTEEEDMSIIDKNEILQLNQSFSTLMDALIKLLIGLKGDQNNAPLSQLLLRLDYNYYFSEIKFKK